MSNPYNRENLIAFHQAMLTFYSVNFLPHEIFDYLNNQTKLSRKVFDFLPFSIVVLEPPHAGAEKRAYVLSNMHVGERGTFGRIKVGYQLIRNGDSLIIDFNRPTAIKISPQIGTVSEDAQRFMAINFQDIYSTGTWTRHTEAGDHSKCYYTMPLYRGQELFDFINAYAEAEESIPLTITLNIMYQLALALKRIHDLGYVHMDIKPPNVIISHDPENNTLSLNLIDFDMLLQENTFMTRRVGTLEYMAPEIQLAHTERGTYFVNHSMDIYSLGRTFEDLQDYTNFLGYNEIIEFNVQNICRSMTEDINAQRPNIIAILRDIDYILTRFNIEKIPSAEGIENHSLLPEGVSPYVQLNIMPEIQPVPQPRALKNITNSPSRPIKRTSSEIDGLRGDGFMSKRKEPIDKKLAQHLIT